MAARLPTKLRPLVWLGSTKKDLLGLPDEVVDTFGYALHLAQTGRKHDQAKPLHGFRSAGVIEVVEDKKRGLVAQLSKSAPVEDAAVASVLGQFSNPWEWAA